MERVKINNVDDLRAYMQSLTSPERPFEENDVVWWACVTYARSACDYNLRDLAWLFHDGVTPVRSPEDVQECIDTYFCWGEPEKREDEEYDEIQASVLRFFGKHNEARELIGC